MDWKKVGAILVIVLLFTALSGCIGTPTTERASKSSVVDSLGRNVSIPKKVDRIVSLAPSNTEILFALGLGDKVVGVTDYCDHPPEARKKDRVGGFSTVNIEKVVSLAPDLILATGGVQEPIVRALESLDLTVVALDAKSISDVIDNIKLVGDITGREMEAEELAGSMESTIETVVGRTRDEQKQRVFYVTWHDPLMSAAHGTLAHELIQLAGGINIAADAKTKYPVYSLEMLVERNPEIIIVSSKHGVGGPTVESIRALLRDTNISAVRSDRIHGIDTDLVARAGPRIVDGLEEMARFIHPEGE